MAEESPQGGRPSWKAGALSALLLVAAIPLIALLAWWILPPVGVLVSATTSAQNPVDFERDRAQLEEIVTWVQANADCSEPSVNLPDHLADLSVNGVVSGCDEEFFLPQWAGLFDDAGGFWYSPGRSPAGFDMWGMICEDPVDLGDGWWSCGMGSP